MTRWRDLCHWATELLLLQAFDFPPISPSTLLPVSFQRDRHPKHLRCQQTANCRQLPYCLLLLLGCCPLRMWAQCAGLEEDERGGWGGDRAIVSGLAEGQEPLVWLQWVRRLTESRQSQDGAWDIDRLEPEGSCRIGTHCQRAGYHHRLLALEGGRGREERGARGAVVGRTGREERWKPLLKARVWDSCARHDLSVIGSGDVVKFIITMHLLVHAVSQSGGSSTIHKTMQVQDRSWS